MAGRPHYAPRFLVGRISKTFDATGVAYSRLLSWPLLKLSVSARRQETRIGRGPWVIRIRSKPLWRSCLSQEEDPLAKVAPHRVAGVARSPAGAAMTPIQTPSASSSGVGSLVMNCMPSPSPIEMGGAIDTSSASPRAPMATGRLTV
jgi:hypothetical protein